MRHTRFSFSLRCALSLVCWWVLLWLPRAALAESANLTDPLAQGLKADGDAAMQASRFEDALSAYERASAVQDAPSLHFNRARALQALRRYAEALRELEVFKTSASPELRAKVPDLEGLTQRLRAQVSWIRVEVSVAGAVVSLRGERLGESPLSKVIAVNAGPAQLTVSKPGFKRFEKALTLPGGESFEASVKLEKIRQDGMLRITSPVPGASVEVNGRTKGSTPMETRLSPGKHTVRLFHPDYDPISTTVVLEARQTRTVDIALEPRAAVYEKWWFWGAVGAVLAVGAVTVIALTTERDPDSGDIPPGTVRASLVSF